MSLSVIEKGSTFIKMSLSGEEASYLIKSDFTEYEEFVSGSTVIFTDLEPTNNYIFSVTSLIPVIPERLVKKVIITQNRRVQLSLAEVQLLNANANTNFARINGTATQSSTGFGGVASRAIDNNTSNSYGNGGITHTKNTPGWWKLTMTNPVAAKRIKIFNRGQGLHDRLRGAILQVFDQDGGIITQKTLTSANTQVYTWD